MLLGDFNSTYGAEPEAILEAGGLLTYLEAKRPSPTILHFPEPIDQIVVGPGFTELRADSLTVHGDFGDLSRDAWRRIYSDHFPVTADIVARGDDDHDATFARGGDDRSLPPKDRPPVVYPAPQSRAPARQPSRWPPAIGTEVTVHSTDGLIIGRLANPMPEGPGGWVVVETADGYRAIPWDRVSSVTLRGK